MEPRAEPDHVLWASAALLPDGWSRDVRIGIRAGRINSIERGTRAHAGDAQAWVLLPGMPNLHSHAFQRGMAGLTEFRGPAADNFWSWRSLMYRFVGRMTPEDLEAVTTWAFIEMLEAGFTRVGEFHYVHHDPSGAPYADPAELTARVVAAAERTGIALTLLPVFYAHGGFGGAPANEGQRRFLHDVPSFARLLEASRTLTRSLRDAVLGIAPHSLRAVTPAQLEQLLPLATGPIHLHAAEQVGEVEQCVAWCGARPVQWLLDHAPLDERWCLVHATHLDDHEVAGLARTGAVAGLCPVTEANLGDGIFRAAEFFAAGGRFGIGTDSNVSISVSDELRQLEYSQRLRARARNVVTGTAPSTGRSLFEAGLRGGSQALGVPGLRDAGLALGAAADFISLDAEAPVFAERAGDALLDSFIFGGARDAVDGVWRAGEQVVRGGRHHAREPALRAWRSTLQRLLAD